MSIPVTSITGQTDTLRSQWPCNPWLHGHRRKPRAMKLGFALATFDHVNLNKAAADAGFHKVLVSSSHIRKTVAT
jgi:hypothetical protein